MRSACAVHAQCIRSAYAVHTQCIRSAYAVQAPGGSPRRHPKQHIGLAAFGPSRRDRFGNAADVERPSGAPTSYFSVARTGGAGGVKVRDAFVSFAATRAGLAGIAVTLGGVRVQDDVEVVADV